MQTKHAHPLGRFYDHLITPLIVGVGLCGLVSSLRPITVNAQGTVETARATVAVDVQLTQLGQASNRHAALNQLEDASNRLAQSVHIQNINPKLKITVDSEIEIIHTLINQIQMFL